ncbi:MAG: glutathione peroxidase [Bacteroidetes bacterium]|nr:glutathione peroxidase [Bacteroidota bacterium]MBU1579196.1 glutathione peroxidase [Bacteroidota bacterium]MBU2465288.1 glutathione peroxidase [Bacteroidota bacterium]MBU2556526.1 glutathione peroxidase [Bacteroidota bacterium]
MKATLIILLSIITMGSVFAQEKFHDFVVKDIDGNEFAMASLKGKKVMVVNTASKCGLTPQYEKLESLYKQYGNENFVIVGFPANNFMNQEPGTAEEIKSFCSINYGVTFPMMSKISVKGKDMHPLYQWLTEKDKNGIEDSSVSWNFQKYLIDEKGNLVKVLSPRTDPMDEDIIAWLSN